MIFNEFDENKIAVINPKDIVTKIPDFPKIGISCFSIDLFNRLNKDFKLKPIAETGNANGKKYIYKLNYKGIDIAVFLAAVGAPACIGDLEDLYEFGLEKLIIFGTCGVLDKNISDLAIIIPTSAVREEGTSYHYQKASREIELNEKYITDFIDVLNEHNVSYTLGKTWTTDAFYRETKDKIKKRKEEGCTVVDMEASAIKAVSNFRGKEVFQFFYAADNLDDTTWDKRSIKDTEKLDEKEKILYLALELATRIEKE